MDMLQAMRERHSVRNFTNQPIEQEKREQLIELVDQVNKVSGLSMQVVFDEPAAFGSSILAKFGKFSGAANYIACVGTEAADLDEKVGYYGEALVLEAQRMGLNTCWVGLTYSKKKSGARINPGERLVCVIALGYGTTPGIPRKTKPIEELCSVVGEMPAWFEAGMEAAQLAPTAMNQQKFLIELQEGSQVSAKSLGGPYSSVDLGIVRYHFEIGANALDTSWTWTDWPHPGACFG